MTLSTTPSPVRRDPSLWARLGAVARGLTAVLAAVVRITAAAPAALLSARLGTSPGWLRRLGRRVADRYRLGYHHAHDITVIDDDQEESR